MKTCVCLSAGFLHSGFCSWGTWSRIWTFRESGWSEAVSFQNWMTHTWQSCPRCWFSYKPTNNVFYPYFVLQCSFHPCCVRTGISRLHQVHQAEDWPCGSTHLGRLLNVKHLYSCEYCFYEFWLGSVFPSNKTHFWHIASIYPKMWFQHPCNV